MKKLFPAILAIIALLLCNNSFAQVQKKDKGTFVEPKSEFWDSIKKSAEDFSKKDDAKKKAYQLDFSNYKIPQSIDEFNKQWHNEPISQGWTGTCWCFSTTSYLESEVNRQFGKKLKISEIYTVYWEYVEKARRFVTEHGNSAFGEGSEANAVTRIWKQYGCVPEEAYTGLKPGQTFHDHTKLFDEMNNYLQSVKKSSSWNEETVLSTIKSILNQFLGVPPEFVVVDGKKMTPLEYFHNVVKINPDDYIDIYSIMEKPYYEKVEYEVTDNWWKSTDYYNVPLDVFMNTCQKGLHGRNRR
jgi:bleomycin hydrolase